VEPAGPPPMTMRSNVSGVDTALAYACRRRRLYQSRSGGHRAFRRRCGALASALDARLLPADVPLRIPLRSPFDVAQGRPEKRAEPDLSAAGQGPIARAWMGERARHPGGFRPVRRVFRADADGSLRRDSHRNRPPATAALACTPEVRPSTCVVPPASTSRQFHRLDMLKEVSLGSKSLRALRQLQENSQSMPCEPDDNIAFLNVRTMVHESRA